MSYSLTAAREEDFEELASLRIAAMRESLERVGRFDPGRARERLRKSFRPEHTLLIVVDAQCVGFYALRPSDGALVLDHLYVHPDHQGRGIGSAIVKSLLQRGDEQGLQIRVAALRDSDSNRFYQRHGFRKVSEDEWDIHYVRG